MSAVVEYFERLDHYSNHHVAIVGPWGHGGRRGCESRDIRVGTYSCGEADVYGDLSDFILSSGRNFSEKWIYIDGPQGCWSHHLINNATTHDDGHSFAWNVDTVRF